MREEIFKYAKKKYGVEPDYPFRSGRTPIAYPVLCHEDNRKIFVLIMDVPREKLGLDGTDRVDIINVKMGDPLLADMLSQQTGYFHGYHISRGNWISILLDGTVPFEDICRWIDESYAVTASKQEKQKMRQPKEWIVPANPKEERNRLERGESGTRNWSDLQRKMILAGKIPQFNGKAIEGHHTYSAVKYPHLANHGEIIYPVTHFEHLFGWHGGSYKKSKPGQRIRPIKEF